MEPIKAIIADADGTLIEGGNIHYFPPELKNAVETFRTINNGNLSTASSRGFPSSHQIYQNITNNAKPKKNEAALYEGCCLKDFQQTYNYVLGGLAKEQLKFLEDFALNKRADLFKGLVPYLWDELTIRRAFVTREFKEKGVTNEEVLQERYEALEKLFQEKYPDFHVSRSKDGLDFEGFIINEKGQRVPITKALATKKYIQITQIPPSQIAAIGDAANDFPMFDEVSRDGGLIIFVGNKAEHISYVKENYPRLYLPSKKGPLGTAEGIEFIFKHNAQQK